MLFRRPYFPLLFVFAAACGAAFAPLSRAQGSALGFDPERLQRLERAIEADLADDRLAGAVMLIQRDGQVAHLGLHGWSDQEGRKPMRADTIMRIASMSKAVTTVAALMLYEEGRFRLHDPLERYLPEFANPVVAVPAADGNGYTTEPAKRSIQIIDLMRHTAGLTYGHGLAQRAYEDAGIINWYFADKDETIGEVVARLATLPLHGHPGEQFQYGFSTDVLGRLVEVVSGQPLDQFMAERIFGPLGMVDTHFFLPPEKVDRLAVVYGYEEGQLVTKETAETSDYVQGPRKCFSGGAGLLSTALDYARFLQMLLNEGQLEGTRLLAPATVQLMHANHTGDLYEGETGAFGLGFWVIEDLGTYGELGSPGAYGWGSAYYPQYLVDPRERMIALFMTQLMPTGGLTLNQRFKVLTYQALIE